MPELACELCEYVWFADFSSTWICPNCTMAVARNTVRAATDADHAQVAELVNRFWPSDTRPDSVLLSDRGDVSVAQIELAAMLFDVVYIIEPWGHDFASLQEERIVALIESGAVLPIGVDWLSMLDRDQTQRWKGRIIDEIVGPDRRLHNRPLLTVIENLAAFNTWNDFGALSIEESWRRLSETIPTADLRRFEIAPGLISSWHVTHHLFNRLNGHAIIAALLGVPLITDRIMSGVVKAKAETMGSRPIIPETTRIALTKWYSDQLGPIGTNYPIEKLIAFRQDDEARGQFIQFLRTKDYADPSAMIIHLNHTLRSAQAMSSEATAFHEALLSGLVSTLGGIIGGTIGAVIGGVGAPILTRAIAGRKAHVPSWATYFVDIRGAG